MLDLPDDWADQSSLVFVAPREAQMLPTTAPVATPTEAIQIDLMLDTFGDPQAFLEDQAQQLSEVDEQFEILTQEDFASQLGTGRLFTQRLRLEGFVVRQLVAAFSVGPVIIVASAVAADERFNQKEEQLRQILSSIGARSSNA